MELSSYFLKYPNVFCCGGKTGTGDGAQPPPSLNRASTSSSARSPPTMVGPGGVVKCLTLSPPPPPLPLPQSTAASEATAAIAAQPSKPCLNENLPYDELIKHFPLDQAKDKRSDKAKQHVRPL